MNALVVHEIHQMQEEVTKSFPVILFSVSERR